MDGAHERSWLHAFLHHGQRLDLRRVQRKRQGGDRSSFAVPERKRHPREENEKTCIGDNPSEEGAVLKAMRSWRYRPAKCNGVPIDAEARIQFRLP